MPDILKMFRLKEPRWSVPDHRSPSTRTWLATAEKTECDSSMPCWTVGLFHSCLEQIIIFSICNICCLFGILVGSICSITPSQCRVLKFIGNLASCATCTGLDETKGSANLSNVLTVTLFGDLTASWAKNFCCWCPEAFEIGLSLHRLFLQSLSLDFSL